MPYHFLEFFFILALLFLPWVTQQIKSNRYRKLILGCFDDIPDKMGSLNQLLPDDYKLFTKEHADISALFREYQLWLLMCYTEKKLQPVLSDFHRYLARKNRKLFHPNQLEPYFGRMVKEDLFFLETIHYFLQGCERQEKIGTQEFYNFARTPEEDTLTDIGIIAYKIMLAVHIAHETIGVHDFQIEGIQKLIDKSRP